MSNKRLNVSQIRLYSSLVGLLCVAFILPVFGDAYGTLSTWADQSQALKDLQRAINIEDGKTIGLTWAGPGWLALAKIIHLSLGLDPKGALILLNRVTYLSAVFIFTFFIFKQFEVARFKEFIAASLITLTFFFSSNFTYSSTIPWSHFVALPFSILVLYCMAEVQQHKYKAVFLLGVFLGFLASIRMFSAQALIIAAIIWFFYILLRSDNKSGLLKEALKFLSFCVVGLLSGYLFSNLILGEFILFKQYDGLTPYPLSELYTLRVTDFPYKFIQLFIEPCFFTDCAINSWSRGHRFIVADGLNSWTYPLTLQIPVAGWLACVWLFIFIFRFKKIPHLFNDPVLAIGLLFVGAIVLGYSTALLTGADRLKYGYVRDFMDATFIFCMVTVRGICLITKEQICKKKQDTGCCSHYLHHLFLLEYFNTLLKKTGSSIFQIIELKN